jgi:glycosyltransferase involved in cell wall biosynthesis
MRIAVNTRLLLNGKMDGIGWFTYHTLRILTKNNPDHHFFFIFDRPYDKKFVFNDNVMPIILSPPTRHPFLWYFWFEHRIPKLLEKLKIDIFLSTDGYLSLKTDIPSLPVIHDINFEHNPDDLPFFTRNYYKKYFSEFAKKGIRIATVSEYSKQDICKTYNINPDKVDVVYNGSDSIYKPVDELIKAALKQKYTDGKEYFIFIGSLHPRKNVPRLFQAFELFKAETNSDFKLVIVGGMMFKNQDLKNIFSKMKFKEDVIFTGRLLPEELKNVLASAFAMTFVPYFEGFGIPIIEAMNCDVPVITSNVTSMPEVAGDAALLVNPFSVEDIKNAMIKIITDNEFRINLIEKAKNQRQKFSWELTAGKLWRTIEKCLI